MDIKGFISVKQTCYSEREISINIDNIVSIAETTPNASIDAVTGIELTNGKSVLTKESRKSLLMKIEIAKQTTKD